MDAFQEVHCPNCKRAAPFHVFGISAHLVIRYRCKRCKRIVYVKEGFIAQLIEESQTTQPSRV